VRTCGHQDKRISVAEFILPAQLPSTKSGGFAFVVLSRSAVLLFRLLAKLPLRVLHGIGAMLGWVVYLASPTYRRRMRENVLSAGFVDPRILRTAIAEAGRAVLEVPYIWYRPREEVLKLIRDVQGADIEAAARCQGHGVVFLTPHIGCFELLSFWVAREAPLTVLFRPPKTPWVQPVMEIGRARDNIQLAPTNLTGVRRLLRALRAGEAIGLLPDQVPSFGEGEWVEFFGRPAYTMTLPERLQASTGAEVIMIFMERLRRGRGYHVRAMRMPSAQQGESYPRLLNRGIEEAVRQCPAQYLWGYNRYKGSPDRTATPKPVAND
jgi:Kdo2-lipid IVA lauroyltransferase/acyltransferase